MAYDPYHGAFFCRHCLAETAPPRFVSRHFLLEHLSDEHGIAAEAVRDDVDVVYGWYDALAIRERHDETRKHANDTVAARFVSELATIDSADGFLARCEQTV